MCPHTYLITWTPLGTGVPGPALWKPVPKGRRVPWLKTQTSWSDMGLNLLSSVQGVMGAQSPCLSEPQFPEL